MNNYKNKIICATFIFILVLGFCMNIVSPKVSFSMSERRKLASKPTLSMQQVLSKNFMNQFEKYSVDHFVFREQWRTLKALWSKYVLWKQDNNGIYEVDGHLSMMDYPYHPNHIKHATSRFQAIKEMYLAQGQQAYYSIIPDKNYFMTSDHKHLAYDYDVLIEDTKQQMQGMQYIDIFDLLTLDDYYRTDTHWQQHKIVDVANRLLANMNSSVVVDYDENKVDAPFYGVYYGQAALPVKPDEIVYIEHEKFKYIHAYDGQNQKEIPIYDIYKTTQKDPYEMFLHGPLSLVELHNNGIHNGTKLVIFRDSFTSSLAPLLSLNYEHITLVDIRYLPYQQLSQYVDFKDSDLLFIYSTFVLNNSETIK